MVSSKVRWWHCLPISALIHASLGTACLYFLPDHSSLQVFAVEQPHMEVRMMEPVRMVYLPMEEAEEPPEAVAEDVDPFEASTLPSVVPHIVLEPPKSTSVLSDKPEPTPSQVSEQPLDEVHPESVVTPPSEVSLQTAQTPSDEQVDIKSEKVHAVGEQQADNLGAIGHESRHASALGQFSETQERGADSEKTGANVPDESSIWRDYTRQLSAHFKRRRHYPEMAKKLRITGTVWVSLEIRRDGTLIEAAIKTSSGSSILDQAALSSAQKAFPVPPFPENTLAAQKRILIPYHYKM